MYNYSRRIFPYLKDAYKMMHKFKIKSVGHCFQAIRQRCCSPNVKVRMSLTQINIHILLSLSFLDNTDINCNNMWRIFNMSLRL